MTDPIERWNIEEFFGDVGMVYDKDGDWVRFIDHEAHVAAALADYRARVIAAIAKFADDNADGVLVILSEGATA